MTNQQRIDHYLCLQRHADMFKLQSLVEYYQRKIEKLKEMK